MSTWSSQDCSQEAASSRFVTSMTHKSATSATPSFSEHDAHVVAGSDGKRRLEDHIRSMTLRMFDVFNHRDIEDSSLQYLAPDFHSISEEDYEPCRETVGSEEHLQKQFQKMAGNSDYRFIPIQCSVQLGDRNDKATVWLSGEVSMITQPNNIRVEVNCLLNWQRRTHLGWVCYKCTSLRGVAGDAIPEGHNRHPSMQQSYAM